MGRRWLLTKLDKETGGVNVLAEFVNFEFKCVSVCVRQWTACVCWWCVYLWSTTYHCLIMEECQGSFITEPGCLWDFGARGPAQSAPMIVKRWLNWKEGREILPAFIWMYERDKGGDVCVCKSQEGRTRESVREKSSSQHASGLLVVPL